MSASNASSAGGRTIAALARRCIQGGPPDAQELLRLATEGSRQPHELMYWAHRLRTRRFGNAVRFCAIVPGKLGGCAEDCKWCAQTAAAGRLPKPSRTPMADLLAAATRAETDGAVNFGIVNSGRRPTRRDLKDLEAAFQGIRGEHAGLGICASVGELTGEQAARLVAAGVRRYNHNLETSGRMYGRMVTTHTYDDRLATLKAAKAAGLSLCCGGIFGLGETWEDRVEMALTLRDQVAPDVVPLNFLHPIPGTALEHAEPLRPMEILTIIAFFRLALPDVDIKIAGGREVNLRDLQSWMFYAGATSALIGNYLTTAGRPAAEDRRMVEDLGLQIVKELPQRTGRRGGQRG